MKEQEAEVQSMDLSKKNIEDSAQLFEDLYSRYPEVGMLDLSENQLKQLPSDLSQFTKLFSLDITKNPFENLEQVVGSLLTLPALTHLKISLSDESQVKLIFANLTNLEYLNGNSTKEEAPALGIIDLEDEEIKNISLNNEINSFNEIFKRLLDRYKSIYLNQNIKEDFQNLLKNEIGKLNANSKNIPNYIYAANVIESQLAVYSLFSEKFSFYLNQKDQEDAKLNKIIVDNIVKSYLLLIKIIYKLYPKITEKTHSMQMQLDEVLVKSGTFNDLAASGEGNDNDSGGETGKLRQIIKEKDNMLLQYIDENKLLQMKVEKLQEENKVMTDKLIANAKSIVSNNLGGDDKNMSNNYNAFSIGSPKSPMSTGKLQRNNSYGKLNNSNSKFGMTNSEKNYYMSPVASQQNGPMCTRVFTIKMMKDTMNDIYNSKVEFDKKADEYKLPRETLEQHMYTFLNHKYGIKPIIIEWASNIINGIKIFSSEDSEVALFGKILRNEIEENARIINENLKKSLLVMLRIFYDKKFKLKNVDIDQLIKEKQQGLLTEEEWKKLIYIDRDEAEGRFLENKIMEVIQKKYMNKTNVIDNEAKLTREELLNLTMVKEENNIPFKELLNILHEFYIKKKEKYLRNFVILFKRFDTDNNGIINEEEFIAMMNESQIYGDKTMNFIHEILLLIDPNNNKQITFSECVNLFQTQIYFDESNSPTMSVLDQICIKKNTDGIMIAENMGVIKRNKPAF